MFKLLRLAIYALVGYAAYQFVMDLVHATQEPQKPQRRGQGQGQARGSRSGAANRSRSGGSGGNGGTRATGGARMTATARAGGQGKQEETQNPDGGSVRHRVGRGVV